MSKRSTLQLVAHAMTVFGLAAAGVAAAAPWRPLCPEGLSCFQPQLTPESVGSGLGTLADAAILPYFDGRRLWLSNQSASRFGLWSMASPDLTPLRAPDPDIQATPHAFANTSIASHNDFNIVQAPDGALLVMGVTVSRYAADGSAPETINWTGNPLIGNFAQFIGPPVVVKGIVYAGIAGYGGHVIYRSTDSGRTWAGVAATNPLVFRQDAYALSDNPARSGLWALAREGGLWESLDQGASWQRVDNGSLPPQTARLVLDPTLRTDVYALTRAGLYASRDAGRSWTVLHPDVVVNSLVFSPAGPGGRRMLIGTDLGVLLSGDGGATWTPFASGLPAAPHTVGVFNGLLVATNASGYFVCPGADCAGEPMPMENAGGGTLTVSEFHNVDLDHYFVTASDAEARGIDAGAAGPGWRRTGQIFRVWPLAAQAGTVPACRFYGSMAPGPNSHFFTTSPAECSGLIELQARTPASQPRWNFEHYAFAAVPAEAGNCPAGSVPVWRAYNNGFARGRDSNHRFVTDRNLIAPLVAAGWIDEGVAFCAAP